MIGRRYRIGKRPEVYELRAHGVPFDRGPRRNVLLVNVETGEWTIRPFRGLRRVRD